MRLPLLVHVFLARFLANGGGANADGEVSFADRSWIPQQQDGRHYLSSSEKQQTGNKQQEGGGDAADSNNSIMDHLPPTWPNDILGKPGGETEEEEERRQYRAAATTPSAAVSSSNETTASRLRMQPPTEEERAARRREQKLRMEERRERVRDRLRGMPPPPREQLKILSKEDIEKIKARNRNLGWFSSGSSAADGTFSLGVLADPSEYYDKWQQAYRMLGGFIDCDHSKSESSHDSGGDDNNYYEDETACSRWMMWAAYVNPNYQGNEYYEYFGDNPTSVLDCHSPDTEWVLLGVYRQEFYQYIEQISKHLWAIDEYEYVVALAGLSYMTDYDCFAVGSDNSGNSIYAGVAPQPYGKFEMALYTDPYCLEPDDSLGMTYDDFGLQTEIDLGSKDETDDDSYSWASDWWYDTQEYTLTQLNDVYESFKYCTTCVDYPTYQDGYFIGDYGTDDDDLINQCWKFHSHDSFICEAECIAKGNAQGTILSIEYGDTMFGSSISGFYQSSHSSTGESSKDESPFSRLLANAFLTLSFLLFVATFLAFAVARRSRYRESRSSRSRRLLDDDGDGRSRKSRRASKGRSSSAAPGDREEGDGIFRSSHSHRGKSSSDRKSSSRNKSTTKSRKSEKSSSSRKRRAKSYDPPKQTSSSRSRSTGRAERAERAERNEDYF